MRDRKVQWHPGFVAAMSLELAENRENLVFEKEYNLNTKPLEIDLLVIKKEASVQIGNEIGAFFLGHNIMEYKSPEDHWTLTPFIRLWHMQGFIKLMDKQLMKEKRMTLQYHCSGNQGRRGFSNILQSMDIWYPTRTKGYII